MQPSPAALSAVIRTIGSEFIANGKCEKSCSHGILHQPRRAAVWGTIEIFRSAFRHNIKSRASRPASRDQGLSGSMSLDHTGE
jgi:hypothetical protein